MRALDTRAPLAEGVLYWLTGEWGLGLRKPTCKPTFSAWPTRVAHFSGRGPGVQLDSPGVEWATSAHSWAYAWPRGPLTPPKKEENFLAFL